jgi:L-ascorbate metabolism protein UlaG (beta-lactamase superfamily)
MKITKYEHACLDIVESTTRLVIDPGVYSKSFDNLLSINAVVITHVHQDHFDVDKIKMIVEQNPDVQIFTTKEVAEGLPGIITKVVSPGQVEQAGEFTLEFFGDTHATIDESYPACQNTGVLINNKLYYPGDSLTPCPKPYEVLAVPTMAPWLKFSEASNFIQKSQASQVFPTHNGFINADGQALYDRLLGSVCEQTGKKYQFIKPGESIET